MRRLSERNALPFWISVVTLCGCATTKEEIFPEGGPTMLEIYEAHMARTAATARELELNVEVRSPTGGGISPASVASKACVSGWQGSSGTREPSSSADFAQGAQIEIERLFPKLPNPTLVMYVFPHLAGPDNLPVPGYGTGFSMYERTEFALPGEVSQPVTRGARECLRQYVAEALSSWAVGR